ncbi:hypothetical protein SLEP1_g44722 [Rubroshorea leprosula]|uniref:Clp1 N-terminal domain-containing protein n=1 Tax=Rubroshorea leprosula TaxID=152421 RepID=A0AAV5LIF5_9ROSI|nr:hypothetical protein SLEP1_g44722 [Rubroshorea leprosula]
MYNGIGLQTPWGCRTNGYIQSNKFFVKPKVNKISENTRGFEPNQGIVSLTKKHNKDILKHMEEGKAQAMGALTMNGSGSSSIKQVKLERASELKIEVRNDTSLHLRLLNGSTEIFGSELALEIWLTFPPRLKFVVIFQIKHEHAFLDRDARWKKHSDDDSKPRQDDKKKGAKNVNWVFG